MGLLPCLPRHAPTKRAHVGWLPSACCEMALYCCRAACGAGVRCVEGGGVLLCVEASGEARSWGLTSRARGVVPPWVQRLCEVSRFSVALVWLTVDATYVLHVFVGFGFHFYVSRTRYE